MVKHETGAVVKVYTAVAFGTRGLGEPGRCEAFLVTCSRLLQRIP
jgi:hypothetical protein